MKYGSFTFGQIEALISILGGEKIARKIISRDLDFEVKEAIKKLFDKNGRRIPPSGLKSAVANPDKNFYLEQPAMKTAVDFQKRIEFLEESLGIKTGITGEVFKEETERLLTKIRENKENSQISNVLNSVWLPVILPRFQYEDLGEELERLLVGVERSYKKTLSKGIFDERCINLKGKVSAVYGHERLIEELKENFVIGIYFPNCLQGFSVGASREQMEYISFKFILSGIDEVVGMIMYPDILSINRQIPGLCLSGLTWRSAIDESLFFRSNIDTLCFFSSTNVTHIANGSFSSGLFFK